MNPIDLLPIDEKSNLDYRKITKHRYPCVNELDRKIRKIIYGAIKRCRKPHNETRKVYYDRGITVCKEWCDDPRLFVKWALENGYKENLVLDRIDNEKGYSPDNCRWVNHKDSARNKRKLERNVSGYIGVRQCKNNGYEAVICINNKYNYLGRFKTPLDAAKAYDTYVIEHNLLCTLNNVLNENERVYKPELSANNKSGYKHVFYDKHWGKWRAVITINKVTHRLGAFATPEEANKKVLEFKKSNKIEL